MKEKTPFERCVITQFLDDVLNPNNEVREPCKLTWVDWACPIGLFTFLLAVVIFMRLYPNGII